MQITGGVFTQTTCLFSNQGEIRAIGNGSYNNLQMALTYLGLRTIYGVIGLQ